MASGVNHVYELTNACDFVFNVSPSYRDISGLAGGVAIGIYDTTGSAPAAPSTTAAAINRFEVTFGQFPSARFVIAQPARPS